MHKETILHLDEDEYPSNWQVIKAEFDHLPKLTLQSNQIKNGHGEVFRFEVTMYNRQRTEDDFTFEYPRIIVEGYKPEYFDRVEYTGWDKAPQFYPDKDQFIPLFLKGAKPDDHQSSVP